MQEGSRLALSATGIFKRWGSLEVLAGANLELAAGSTAWLGGRNGAGKTTLLRIAAGLIEADAGEVTLEGYGPLRSRRAMAFAPFGLLLIAAVLIVKQAVGGATWVIAGISLISGLYFPVSPLPDWIE